MVHFRSSTLEFAWLAEEILEKTGGSFLGVTNNSSLYFWKEFQVNLWFILRSGTLVSALLAGEIPRKLVIHF